MAKRKTAKKKTAKRARAAKSTTVTTMTTKTTRTTTSRNPQYEEKMQTGGSTVTVRGVGDVVIDNDGRVARVPGSIPGRGEIIATRFGKRWKPTTSKMRSMTAAERKSVVAVLDGMDWTGVGNPQRDFPAEWTAQDRKDYELIVADERRKGTYDPHRVAREEVERERSGYGARENPDLQWKHNASTGNDIAQITKNVRVIRQGHGGNYLYKLEHWGDYSLDFPVSGRWQKTLKGALGEQSRLETKAREIIKKKPGQNPANPSGAQTGTREWYRRNLIVDEGVVERVMQWHGGQGTELYSFGSTAGHDYVSPSMAQRAIDALEYEKGKLRKAGRYAKNKREIDNLIGDLQAYTIFSSEHTTKEAGLGDVDSGLDERGMRDDEVSFETNPALLYSERTMILVEEEENALQQNPAKGSGKAPTFTKVADRVYVGRGAVKGQDVYGKPRSWSVDFRLDGRDGDFYRVDMHTLGPWEAIDGGEQSAPKTLPAARAMVAAWLAAASEQHTLSPRLESRAWVRGRAANPAPTERQIRSLLYEAGEHGDLVMAHICRVALGDEEPVVTADEFEDRYGGGGFDEYERKQIMDVGSQAEAIVICEEAIASARARRERNPAPAREKNPRLASLSRRISGV